MRAVGKTVLLLCAVAMLLSVTVFDPSEITSNLLERFVDTRPEHAYKEPEVVADPGLQTLLRSIREEEVRTALGSFSSLGSRVVGYPGCDEAYELVRSRFEEIGLEDITTETFEVAVPVDKGAQLTLLDDAPQTVPLYALWPSGVRTPTLPSEGIEGSLVYGGRGTFAELDGKPMKGSVVVLSFDCGQNFINPRMLGAQAVIFYGAGGVTQGEASQKFLKVSVDLPRYWVQEEEAEEVLRLAHEGGHRVRLNARMDWEMAETKNIYGWIRGDGDEKDAIVVEAYYDAMSVVPAVAPGAENACGIVGLLTLAERLKTYGTRHPVLFLATSGHFEALSGINDFLYRHARGKGGFRKKMSDQDRIDFRLFVGLDLSSESDQVASFFTATFNNSGWGTDNYLKNMMAPYAAKFSSYGAELFPGQRPGHPRHVDAITPPKRSWKHFMPVPLGFNCEAVSFVGHPGMTLGTPDDIRERVDTPLDLPEHINFSGLTKQVQTLTGLLLRAANDPVFFVDSKLELKDQGHTLDGRVVWFDREVHFAVPQKPVPQAVVTYQMLGPTSIGGVRTLVATMTDAQGVFQFDIMRNVNANKILAYQMDEDGRITSAPDLGQEGDASYPISQPYGWWENHMLEVLFPCRAISLFEIVDSRYLSTLDYMMVLGEDDAPPQSYGSDYVENQSTKEGMVTRAAVVFAKPDTRVKVFMSTGLLGIKYLLTNAPEEWVDNPPQTDTVDEMTIKRAMGTGYSVEQSVLFEPAFKAARDMWVLDDIRMKQLARYGVKNEKLEGLHSEAREALILARDHLDNLRYGEFISEARRAWGLEARGYPDVKGTANDTVRGIVFYFGLLLPFSFFAERLLFSFADIRKQIAGVSGIFILVFGILRFVHPAFKLSTSPYIIFLAFVIFAMSIVVLVLVLSKFGQEVRKFKQSATGMQETDVGRLSATAAAIMLGISNLKKRRVRTALTATTLILLTFTVLSFTSVQTSLKFYKLPRDNRAPYSGMLVRDRSWKGFQESVLDYVQSAFEDQALVVPRSWYVSQLPSEKAYISFEALSDKEAIGPRFGAVLRANERDGFIGLEQTETKTMSFANALLGMRPEETEVTHLDRLLIGNSRWFVEGERDVCILPDDLAQLVGITENEIGRATIRMMGTTFKVIGLIDSEALNTMKDLDDEKLTPVDTAGEAVKMAKGVTDDPRLTASSNIETFAHLESSNVIVVPHEVVMEIGGTLRSIAVTNFPDENFVEAIEAFMSRVALTVFVGREDKVTVYSSMGATSLSGWGNLFIPILIAALIVLNTMMGAVYERFKEIRIYSSVGLAPSHIGSLFLAEAAVFATIGAVMGYLIGQVLAMVLSSFDVLAGISLNYSSLSAVSSTLIVMVTVFLSAIYPAKKAANMAVPDVTRKWKFPEPDGDKWLFDFPFTVGGAEVLGICAYLTRVFDSYAEGSVGDFMTEGAQLSARNSDLPSEPIYEVSTKTWLAPYDLGVSQNVRMSAIPTGEHGVYRVEVAIHLQSGDVASWQRLNRGFLNILRKRFLVWRTIPAGTKETYVEEGRQATAPS
ncbi:MAG: FtsX-like permease family protein [Candidatus Latescibacterota bacterium]